MLGKDLLIGSVAVCGITSAFAIGLVSINNNNISVKNTIISTSIIGINSIIAMFTISKTE
jgi:hypothetical protein